MEEHSFQVPLDCHYLLHTPASVSSRTLLAVTLHGYGSNPQEMLRLTRMMLGDEHAIAALQAPYHFFLSPKDASPGYSWATSAHHSDSIRLHHDMVRQVFREAGDRLGIGLDRRLLIGFSQPVGLNYRLAATHPAEVRGVIGICGGLPRDWETAAYGPVSAALLHIARSEDEFYPPTVTARYAERMRIRAANVEFHQLDGGHRFPSKAGPIVAAWIERVIHEGLNTG